MTQDSLMQDSLTLGTLIGSRICHDIISPIGAIGNGLELVALTGKADTPEMELIAQSVAGANARIRFYRVALGLASTEQKLGLPEITSILKAFYDDGRLDCDWQVERDASRSEVQAVFLALLCAGTALPTGGMLTVTQASDTWQIEASGAQTRAPEPLWSTLKGGLVPDALQPSEVQFAMLPRCVATLERVLSYEIGETAVRIRF